MATHTDKNHETTATGQTPRAAATDPVDWAFAEWALEQAEKQYKQETDGKMQAFAKAFGQWILICGLFQKIEHAIMFESKPDEQDLRIHMHLCSGLMALGSAFIEAAKMFDRAFVESIGFDQKEIEEQIARLKHAYEAFHTSANEKRMAKLRKKIFDAEA